MAEVRRLAADLEMKNMFIRQIFGRYVTDDVVQSLLETPEGLALGGEKRTVTVLMSDLRGFSTLAERLAPERVVELINIYLGAMAEVIGRYGGMIDEFIGDAILAVFGAPVWREDHARRAVACALSMQLAMDEVNARIRSLGVTKLEMGVGIHTGEVIVGNIGSTKRAKYGVVGSNVNLAARIEAATVGGEVIISEPTASHLRPLLKLDRQFSITAKGSRLPLQLYSVIGLGGSYNLNLPRPAERFVALAAPVRVDCCVMTESKQPSADSFAGELTSLSVKGAVLKSGHPLEVTQNLLLRLADIGSAPGAWEVYAKVLHPAELPGSWIVRYTSLPPDADQRLRRLAGLP
jgi:adenylate cyclase